MKSNLADFSLSLKIFISKNKNLNENIFYNPLNYFQKNDICLKSKFSEYTQL